MMEMTLWHIHSLKQFEEWLMVDITFLFDNNIVDEKKSTIHISLLQHTYTLSSLFITEV